MNEKIEISATIVLYNQNKEELRKSITSFLNIENRSKKLFLIDNSPSNSVDISEFNSDNIVYIFNNKNLGFSKANNLVINDIKETSKYHLILNPDVFFSANILEKLINKLEEDKTLSLITPKVKFLNNKHQYNVRRFPSFLDLIVRKLNIYKKRIHKQEYRDRDLSKPFYPEAIHGCFMLFKTKDFVDLNGFDERYFLYMEDIDICKKIDAIGKKKMYYPNVEITHILKQGSSKNIKLFIYHLSSAIKYFLKWR